MRSTPAWLSKSGGCLIAKALHDHGLAHAAVAVDAMLGIRVVRGCSSSRFENAKHLAGAGILHPAFAEDGTNALIMGRLQQLGGGGVQVG